MLKKGSYFPGQLRDENFILFIRRHWMAFLPWIIFVSLMILVPAILFIIYGAQVPDLFYGINRIYLIVGVSAYILIAMAVFLTAWIDYYLDVTVLNPEHLVDICQTGLFNRKVAEQSLLRVQDVSARMKGILQTFFRYGTVFVETAGDIPNFEMLNIPNPNRVANTILKQHEKLVEHSGLEARDFSVGVGLEPSKSHGKISTLSSKSSKEVIKSINPSSDSQKKGENIIQTQTQDIKKEMVTEKDSFSKKTIAKESKSSFSASKTKNQDGELKEGESIRL